MSAERIVMEPNPHEELLSLINKGAASSEPTRIDLTLEDLNKARVEMGYPAMTLDGTLISTHPDNIERWLRRPYGIHERHWIEEAANGTSKPCPCDQCIRARCLQEQADEARLAHYSDWEQRHPRLYGLVTVLATAIGWTLSLPSRFERAVEEMDARKIIRHLDVFFAFLFGLILIAFGVMMVGGLIRMIAESYPN
jgi:hypothetical protein